MMNMILPDTTSDTGWPKAKRNKWDKDHGNR
jgi:hypothetical protein